MKSFYAYIRVSTVKQGEKGSSLQEQHDSIVHYAKHHGLTISSWFEEKETATKSGRRVFARMVAGLEKGNADGVILHKIDRGARNLWDWARLQGLIDNGIEVHFAHETLDLNTRGGRLSADIQAVVAADYIRNLKDEVRKGINGRLKQGLYPFRAPIGYLDKGKGCPKELDPVSGPLVRTAFELYATGNYRFETLGEELYRLGLRNHAGRRLLKNGLTALLNNPFYIGLIRIKRTGQVFQGIHEPLVTKRLFDRVQAILRGRTNARPPKHRFLFRRLVRCEHCGYSLIGERQKGHVYYRCHKRPCPTTCIREETIDARVRDRLAAIRFTDDELAVLHELTANLKDDWKTRREEHLKAAELALARIDDRMVRLTDAYLDQVIERDWFEKRKEALLHERKAAEQGLAELQQNARDGPARVAEFLELAQSAQLSYETGLLEEKREILQTVTSNLMADGKNIAITLCSPFHEVANRENVDECDPHRDTSRTPRICQKRQHADMAKLFDHLVQYFGTGNIEISPR